MRTTSASQITFASANEATGTGTQTRVAEAAAPDIMQAKVAAIIAELAAQPQTQWVLTHVDLAGGGDGHTFVFTMEFANADVITTDGIEVEEDELAILFYMASQSEALAEARAALRPQLAALFPASSAIVIRQTLEDGAAKGTRFMGALVIERTPNIQ